MLETIFLSYSVDMTVLTNIYIYIYTNLNEGCKCYISIVRLLWDKNVVFKFKRNMLPSKGQGSTGKCKFERILFCSVGS
jgi:hypothetical protein